MSALINAAAAAAAIWVYYRVHFVRPRAAVFAAWRSRVAAA